MNGVDHADQLRTAYSIYCMSQKWWKYIFWFLFDVAVSNAFVLMRDSANHQLLNSRNKRVERKQLDFCKAVAKLLIDSHRRDIGQVLHCDPTNSSHFITVVCMELAVDRATRRSNIGRLSGLAIPAM